MLAAQIAAVLVAAAFVGAGEAPRIRQAAASGTVDGWLRWLAEMNLETTPYLLLLVVLPVCWIVRRPLLSVRTRSGWLSRWTQRESESDSPAEPTGLREWLLTLLVAATSLAASYWVASRPVAGLKDVTFGDLPPAYHDEYSYLFMARTFRAGRVGFPSHPRAPELFDQMHVLNEKGRFASRFFPGTGAWMLPFVALGRPYWGHWLAGALSACFIFWAGRELGGHRVGLTAGLLTAVSPGMALFSNLLLAHHPSLVGLTLFLFAFLRMMRSRHWGWALAAGCGLSFAMLCRPMTAAGFGLPFGLWFAWRLLRGETNDGERESDDGVDAKTAATKSNMAEVSDRRRSEPDSQSPVLRLAIALSAPIVLGVVIQLSYDRAITGSFCVTPYQRFTDVYTPRHVYGFNNVLRGERRLGPKVLENYDRWAENLSPRLWEQDAQGKIVPSLAVRNVIERFGASLQWSLAVVPLAMAGAVFLIGGVQSDVVCPGLEGTDRRLVRETPVQRSPEHREASSPGQPVDRRLIRRWWLIPAAIVSLHAVHVPYWYVGIMHWHYVFETGPLWLLLFAGATGTLLWHWREMNRTVMPLWWLAVLGAALLTAYVAPTPFWSQSKVSAAVQELQFSRRKYHAFQNLVSRRVTDLPAVVLIEADPADRHIDFVTNDPALRADVLFGRFLPGRTDMTQVRRSFPDRTLYLYRAADGALTRWRRD